MELILGLELTMIQIKKKLALYIFENFKEINSVSNLYDFVDYFFGRMIWVVRDNEIIGVAVYLWLSDEAIDLIRENKVDLKDLETFKRIEKMKGDNMHFFGAATKEPSLILKGIRQIIKDKKPRTISWMNQDMSRFVCLRGGR